MSIRPFTSQASWTQQNIQAVLNAILSGQIKTEGHLKSIVGNQSKKKYANGELTVGSQMLALKLTSMRDINAAEHQFYNDNTTHLRTLEKEFTPQNGLLKIKENDAYSNYKVEHPGYNNFMGGVYDFTMGRHLAEEGIRMMILKEREEGRNIDREQASQLLLVELREIARLRGEENRIFNELSRMAPTQRAAIQSHEKAENRELSSIRQITEYLENPTRIDNLTAEAIHYQKYLKYKAKYLALKKQLEQKN